VAHFFKKHFYSFTFFNPKYTLAYFALWVMKIKDFVMVNPDKKCLKSNFFVISALEFSNAEFGFNPIVEYFIVLTQIS